MKIFIAGGTGFVGGHLRRELLGRGHALRLLVHKRGVVEESGVELVEGDATSQGKLVQFMNGCDAAINLVGIIREFPSRGVTFEHLHVQATASLLAAATQAGIRRFLQMSALGTRPNALSDYHRTKFRAEVLVHKSALDWTIMRPSLIYGPKDAFINMLAGQLRLVPLMPVVGDGHYRLQPIHGDDVARCFAMALEMPETIGQTYELCGNDRLSFDDLLDSVAAAMGKTAPLKSHVPLGLMKLAVPFLQHVPQFPLTMDQLRMLVEENICDGGWKETFGFEPRGFMAGIREYLVMGLGGGRVRAWYKQRLTKTPYYCIKQ
jgi:NADH dehydrogenase